MFKKLLFLVVAFFSIKIAAQTTIDAQLIELNFGGGSNPKNITNAGSGKFYFSANDDVHGRELWIHVFSENTTHIVKDIYPGDSSSIEAGNFTMVGNILYFTVGSGWTENSLWRSDGTEEGTYLVKDLSDGVVSSPLIYSLISYNGEVFFSAADDIHGSELWKSDGTEAGTVLVKDINPGMAGSYIQNTFVFNDKLYFYANDGIHGLELWQSNGTVDGTALLKDIYQGLGSLQGDKVLIMENNFYFFAYAAGSGRELWKSDGTEEGTQLLKDIVPGWDSGVDYMDGIVNNGYFVFNVAYSGQKGLWRSDGTTEGTFYLSGIDQNMGFMNFSQFVILNNTTYFTAGGDLSQKQLWKTDGTTTGTQLVIDLEEQYGYTIDKLTAGIDFLIFRSNDYLTYPNIWTSDGTPEGTTQLIDLDLTSNETEVNFTVIDNLVVFQASSDRISGIELWQTDGTFENTKMIEEINHSNGAIGDYPKLEAATIGNKIIFAGAEGEHGYEPFVSYGTKETTYLVKDINPGEESSFGFTEYQRNNIFTKAGEKLFFIGNDGIHGREIFCTDGTGNNTVMVKDIVPGSGSPFDYDRYVMSYNNIFYFMANDHIHGNELWRSDGTEEGTYMLKDIYPGPSSSGFIVANTFSFQNKGYAVVNGLLYFHAEDSGGRGIWRTDGTEAGTVKVLEANHDEIILDSIDDKFFIASAPNSDGEISALWSSDGTQNGTVLLGNWAYSLSTQFRKCHVFNNELYFGLITEDGKTIMKSDGTPEGTVAVKGNLTTDTFDDFVYLESCGEYVYFGTGTDSGSDVSYKLWRTDGTENGTVLIADHNNFTDFIAMSDFTCVGNVLLYLQYGLWKNSLWSTNGTVAGTQSIDINITNGEPFEEFHDLDDIISVLNGRLYFCGSAPRSGKELYTAIIDPSALGINESQITDSPSKQLQLYPNPTKGNVTIMTVNNSVVQNIQVFDITGKKLMDVAKDNSKVFLDISILSKGIYFLKIKTNISEETIKVIHD